MTEHPITPPPELIQKWSEQFEAGRLLYAMFEDIYKAGADDELEACRMEIIDGAGLFYIDETSDRVCLAEDIWTARRPKAPSLKQKALDELHISFDRGYLKEGAADTIRRALEQLDD
jgi:hypothetical protein